LSFIFDSQHSSENSYVRKWLVYIFGLPYFNPEEMEECFTTDYFMANKTKYSAIIEFCDRIHTINACKSYIRILFIFILQILKF